MMMGSELNFAKDAPVSFAQKLATSESFKALFREGMTLVEDAASYLDGDGREEAKQLPRLSSLAYAAESMRLTTRLMQLASWLLLQRAVNEGELSQSEALSEKRKVRLADQEVTSSQDALGRLPERLMVLVDSSIRLQARIVHIDSLLYQAQEPVPQYAPAPRTVESQLAMLRSAFETV